MKKILFLFILFSAAVNSQTITPQVINSAGSHRPIGSTGMTLTDNIGEPFIETLGGGSNFIITQGFLQPDLISPMGPTASLIKNDVSCSDKKDGKISIAITNTTTNFSVNYIWTPTVVCPTGNCSTIDSLAPGVYSVAIIITNTTTSTSQTLTPAPITISDQNGPCLVKIYNGITPNGDGNNDVFTIDNIAEFPNNHISIFNRWGVKIFEADKYNNTTVAWPAKNESAPAASTYFYVLNLGNGSVLKGWVEILN